MTSIPNIAGLLAVVSAVKVVSRAAASSANDGCGLATTHNIAGKSIDKQRIVSAKRQAGPFVLADADAREKRNRGHG